MKKIVSFLTLLVASVGVNCYAFSNTVQSTQPSLLAKPIKPAKRIIALAPHIVEMLHEVGALDTVIGTTEHADYPVAAKDIPRVGNYARLNIEQILAADPDLIIAWKSGNPADDLARLEKLGLNIIYSDLHALKDVAKEIHYFSSFVGKAEEGRKVADKFLTRLSQLKQQYQGKEKLTIFFELWSRPLTTTAGSSWSQQQLNVCQITNPFIDSDSDYPQVNIEQVVIQSPDVIIQPTSHGVHSPDRIDWLQWPKMPAVKNNAFVYPNADRLHRMTSRSLNELATLCEQIDSFRQ
ncbi:cobalamin-binding protein [Colwelliaceae bacterium 6441]